MEREEHKIIQKRDRSREEIAVMSVYACMVARIVVDPLLSSFFPSTILRVLELLFLGLMLWFTLRVFYYKAHFKYSGWPVVLICLLALCSISIVVRGDYSLQLKDLVLSKSAYDSIPAYLLPFVVLCLPNRKYILSIFDVLFYSMLFVLPLWLLSATNLVREEYLGEAVGVYLPFFGTLLLLFHRKFPFRRNLVTVSVYAIYLLLMVLNARRNMVVSLVLYAVIAFLMGNATLFKKSMRARLLLAAGTATIAAIVFFSWNTLSSTVFDRILERGMEDTRSGVESRFLIDMASSPASDWLFGRGVDGTYYQMTQDRETMEVSYDRPVIETGYLYLVLKGGLTYLLAILLFLFTALFRGISVKKPLLRGMALFLAVYLIELYMTTPVSYFAVRPIVFWLIVSVCLQYDKSVQIPVKDEGHPYKRSR